MKNNLNILPQLLIIIFTFQVTWCQSKLQITQEDYKKWHTLSVANISDDGLWSSYKLEYEKGIDTIFIQEILSGKRLSFAKATHVTFSPDGKSAIINYPDSSLVIQDLTHNSMVKIDSVVKYRFEAGGKWLAILQNNSVQKELKIYATTGILLSTITDVNDFEWNTKEELAIIESTGISIYDPTQNFRKFTAISDITLNFKNLVWNKSGKVLAFLGENIDAENSNNYFKIFAYDTTRKKLYVLDNSTLNGNHITDNIQTPIILTDHGDQLFFYITTPMKVINDDLVEIWNSASKLVYPAQKIYDDSALKSKIAVWNLTDNLVQFLATDEFPNSFLTWDRKYVLTYSYLTNEPQYEMIAPADIYITNIQNHERKLLLKKHQVSKFTIGCAPSGQFLHYFKNKHWWAYDIKENRHINLTANLKVSFDDSDYDQPSNFEGFSSLGWTKDSKYLILYDKYDIWLVSPDLKTQRRITRGTEQKIRFRVCDQVYNTSENISSADFLRNSYDLSKGLFLVAASNEKATGYFKWNTNGKIEKIAYGDYKFSALKKSVSGNEIVFVKENFATPPTIYSKSTANQEPKIIFQSNAHASKYEWGTSKIITYKNEVGQDLQGALFYPAGFQQGKSYPMIVYIYSKVSQSVYDYYNPTMLHPIGFVPSNYTSNGYLVLFPDIMYKVGDPGKSILDCVKAAVNAVVETGAADEKRVGLIGHSYGGYETSLLITHTPIFAAAVAGAAVTDIFSSYLSVNTITGVKMDWRFESQQFRMGSTPFYNPKGYLENSPVANAANILTPLLSWAGKNDMQCDWRQSIELHLALRRLNKRSVFLAYQNEGHILSETAAQYDLSSRIQNWFDHYLKGIPFPDNANTP